MKADILSVYMNIDAQEQEYATDNIEISTRI